MIISLECLNDLMSLSIGELFGNEGSSLEKLIQACTDTCRMAMLGQCGISVDWVQCSDCEGWMHCICTGITKEPLSGHQFSCCKLANAEAIENLRYIFVHIYVHMSICARHNSFLYYLIIISYCIICLLLKEQ